MHRFAVTSWTWFGGDPEKDAEDERCELTVEATDVDEVALHAKGESVSTTMYMTREEATLVGVRLIAAAHSSEGGA